ncbi:Hypothetical protein PHPALM_17569, partial [Phytophthora palmivora]
MFWDSESGEEEGVVSDPREISNDLGEQQEFYQAALCQGASEETPAVPSTLPPNEETASPMFSEKLKVPRDFNHGPTLYQRRQDRSACDISNTLNSTQGIHQSPEETGRLWGLFSAWGYLWVQPENTTTQSQAEYLFWRWVSLKSVTVQKLKELREDRLLSYVLDQRDLRIEFVHLIAKRQLHSVMEGLRQQSKSSAHDERGYGSVNPGTVHSKAAKKPRTTYAPAVVDPKSQQPSGSQPGAGLPAPTSSVTRGNPATSQVAGASQSAVAL